MSELRYSCVPGGDCEPERGSCPLQHVSVTGVIRDAVAQYTVTQTFANPSTDTSIEAAYSFPLYEGVAVIGFEAEVEDGRKIVGAVQEKAAAKKAYEDATQEGRIASLLEQETGDVFQASIGNIPPSKSVSIRITLIADLKQDGEDNQLRFVVPVSIAPRYGAPPESLHNSNVDASPCKLLAEMRCEMSKPITSIQSPSHKIEVRLNAEPNQARVSLTSDAFLDCDIVIVVQSIGLDEPRALVEKNERDGTHAISLTFVPKFAHNPIASSELIFVVDRSGSMEGERIKQAGAALEIFLRSIPCDDHYFNVIGFGSTHEALFPKSVPYTEESLKEGARYAQSLDADMGGTEMASAFEEAFQRRRRDVPSQIFLLTDGEVWGVDSLCRTIQAAAKEPDAAFVRVFSLGIGDAVSHHLIESVARAGGGYAQLVVEGERMEKKVLNMLKAALVPPVTNLRVQWSDAGAWNSLQPLADASSAEINEADDFVFVKPEDENSQPAVEAPPPAVETPEHAMDPPGPAVESPEPAVESLQPAVEMLEVQSSMIVAVNPSAPFEVVSSDDPPGPAVESPEPAVESLQPRLEVQSSMVVVVNPSAPFEEVSSDDPSPPSPPPTLPLPDIIAPIQQAPFDLPILYGGARFTVYALLAPAVPVPKELVLRGASADGPVELKVPIHSVLNDSTTLHSLAARALVRDLEERSSHIHALGNESRTGAQQQTLERLGIHMVTEGKPYPSVHLHSKYVTELTNKHVVDIATRYKLSSKQTSWVAIDEETQKTIIQSTPKPDMDECGLMLDTSSGTVFSYASAPQRSAPCSMAPCSGDAVPFEQPEEPEPELQEDLNDPHVRLRLLLQHQSFDGSFPLVPEIAALLSTTVEELNAKLEELRKVSGSEWSERVWVTCLAVEFMKKQLPELQDAWELVVEKAEKRVQVLAKGADLRVIKQAAADAIQSGNSRWYTIAKTGVPVLTCSIAM